MPEAAQVPGTSHTMHCTLPSGLSSLLPLAARMPGPLTSGPEEGTGHYLLTFPHPNPCVLMVEAEAPLPCNWIEVGSSSDLMSPH